MTAIENGWTYELQRLRAENARLRTALERTLALAIGHACEARKINESECETWPWVQKARAALAARDDKGE